MAFTGIMATEAEIDQRSGANVSVAFTDTMKTQALLSAESTINTITRINYSDTYAALNVDVKYLLTDIAASLVAIQAITYDMSGFTSRVEAEDMINILRDAALRGMALIRDHKQKVFISDA